MASGVVPAAIEYLDAGTVAAAGASFPFERLEPGFLLVLEADGTRQEAERGREELLEAAREDAVAVHAPTAPADVRALWQWRAGVSHAVTAKRGGKLSEDVAVPLDRLAEAIDAVVAVVAISHVLFRTSYIMDAAAVIRRAHEAGALVILDGYQSAGIIPVDVAALGVDFMVGGCLTWLCGGPGGCFLWANPESSARLEPALTGWQAHARPFAFEGSMEYAPGVARWLGGTPPIPALYAASEGPKLVRAAGIEAIRAKSTRQTARLIELADARGYPVAAPRDPARRGGTVAFDVPHAYEVSQYLLSRDIIVDYRPGAGIRVAPHFYTSDEELEGAVQAIDAALATGDWRHHSARRSVVT